MKQAYDSIEQMTKCQIEQLKVMAFRYSECLKVIIRVRLHVYALISIAT